MSKWREMKVWQEMPWQQQRKDTFYQWKEILQSSNHKALSNQSQYYLEMLKKKKIILKIMILKQNSKTLHRFMWISSILWHIKIKLSFQETIFSHLIWLKRVFLFHKCIWNAKWHGILELYVRKSNSLS